MNAYYDKFLEQPDRYDGCTMVTITDPRFGSSVYYLPLDDFQDNIKGLITPAWVNGMTVIIQPCN